MSLKALLTVGWEVDTKHPLSARQLHDKSENTAKKSTDDLLKVVKVLEYVTKKCNTKENEYEDKKREYEAKKNACYESNLLESLIEHLEKSDSKQITIQATEQLFRRNVNGFGDIKKFIASLISIVTKDENIGEIYCLTDVFSYAFLKGAKNFDFQLPEIKNNFPDDIDRSNLYRDYEEKWMEKIIPALEKFERLGDKFPEGYNIKKEEYLELRDILSRVSARDERRSLATLLVNGPSTMEEISNDLNLNYNLGSRILGIFKGKNINVVAIQNDKYVISKDKLPLVVFFLREIMGLDFLSSLREKE